MSESIITISNKNCVQQLFCSHIYEEGILSDITKPYFVSLNGDTYTTICIKCGKVKGTRFVPNADGS